MRAPTAIVILLLVACDEGGAPRPAASARRTTASASASSVIAEASATTSSSAVSLPAPADAADDRLHLRAAAGPYPSLDEACRAVIASCGAASCRCDRTPATIVGAHTPFLEAASLGDGSTAHPAFRVAAGWFVVGSASPEALAYGDVPGTWTKVTVADVRGDDVLPFADGPEIVMRLVRQIDRAFTGSSNDHADARHPSWIQEIAFVCAAPRAGSAVASCLGPILGAPSLATAATGWHLHAPPHAPVPHATKVETGYAMAFPKGDCVVWDASDRPHDADAVTLVVAP